MNLAKKYLNQDTNHKALWIMVAVAAIGFLLLCPLFLLSSEDGVPYGSYPLGWLLGSLIEIVCYLTIIKMSSFLVSQKLSASSVTAASILFSIGRLILWAAGLLVAAICTFESGWFGGFNAFNFFAVAAAYLPMLFIVLGTQFHFLHHPSASDASASPEEKKEEGK